MELLAPRRETGLHQPKEAIALLTCQRNLVPQIHTQDSGVYLRSGIKGAGRYVRDNFWLPIKLDTHSQQAQIAGTGYDALRDLVLYHHHQQARRISALSKMTEGGRGNI